jgi:hypothetical protein
MMILSLMFAAQAASGQLPPAQPIPPPDFETANVMAPIQQLFAAFDSGDSVAMLRVVYPEGRLTATGTRASSIGLRQESWAQLAQRMTPESRFQERISDPAIEIDGDAAMVWAPFVVRVDGKVSNCGFDHFDLVRENGAWKIMNLTFSSRTTDCPSQ